MSWMTVRKGSDYVVKWDTEADVLRVWPEGVSEPTLWQPLENAGPWTWLELGTVASLQMGGSSRRVVTVRMLGASLLDGVTTTDVEGLTARVDRRLIEMLRAGHEDLLARPGTRKPRNVLEAADQLAEAVQGALFGATRDIQRRVTAAGHEDPREWVETALEAYHRARKR